MLSITGTGTGAGTRQQVRTICGRGRAVGGSRYLNFVRAACEVGPTRYAGGNGYRLSACHSRVTAEQSEFGLTVTVIRNSVTVTVTVGLLGVSTCQDESRNAIARILSRAEEPEPANTVDCTPHSPLPLGLRGAGICICRGCSRRATR